MEQLSSTSGDGLAAAGTASAYLHALSKQAWAGAWATRLRAERQKLAKRAGSCERGIQALFVKAPLEPSPPPTPVTSASAAARSPSTSRSRVRTGWR